MRLKTSLFWHEYNRDGDPELRSECLWPNQPWASIGVSVIPKDFPGFPPGVTPPRDGFGVCVFRGQAGEILESALFDTLEEAKAFAERILVKFN